MQKKIQFIKDKIALFEQLKQTAKYPERIDLIINCYEKELRNLNKEDLKNWVE